MSYTVKNIEQSFHILEKETDTVIQLPHDEKSVREICRKLNLGSGFSGWTPSFFAETYTKRSQA